ncbi:hypothetical protein IMZ48_32290 [Candidatus Bathyarchaeota archaeon]|nr:hypothetical protein [Candidatus Bathyarchaeota archaeon]
MCPQNPRTCGADSTGAFPRFFGGGPELEAADHSLEDPGRGATELEGEAADQPLTDGPGVPRDPASPLPAKPHLAHSASAIRPSPQRELPAKAPSCRTELIPYRIAACQATE